MKVLVTGADGAIGREVMRIRGDNTIGTDIDTMDVTRPEAVWKTISDHRPAAILHLAGAKHAPEGETDPETTARINVEGTANVLRAAAAVGARVVTASTCKACDPETVYGATKLIAERMTLNEGGVVVRFFNVPEAGGNVFRLWESLPADQPLPVTDAWRYFLPMADAVSLTLAALKIESGRWSVDPGKPRHMPDLAAELYPGREQTRIPLRRGDRHREPLCAASETLEVCGQLMRIRGSHDPKPNVMREAA